MPSSASRFIKTAKKATAVEMVTQTEGTQSPSVPTTIIDQTQELQAQISFLHNEMLTMKQDNQNHQTTLINLFQDLKNDRSAPPGPVKSEDLPPRPTVANQAPPQQVTWNVTDSSRDRISSHFSKDVSLLHWSFICKNKSTMIT